jgi:hypothetical protein
VRAFHCVRAGLRASADAARSDTLHAMSRALSSVVRVRCAAVASATGLLAIGAGCSPPAPQPQAPPQQAPVAPAALTTFWSGLVSNDPLKLEGALGLLLANPEIADAPFVASFSLFGAGPLGSSNFTWSFADGTTITLDPGVLKRLGAAIDAAVVAAEPDAARQMERRVELLDRLDKLTIGLWEASAAFEARRGGLLGENSGDRLARESALFDLRSYAVLLGRIGMEERGKLPAALVDQAALARRGEELKAWRKAMLSNAPGTGSP